MSARFFCFIILLSTVIFGNTYYIDYAGGSDANPGTSTSSPWKRCPGMNGFSATYTHTPGDVYIFKGGVTWPAAALPFTIANSGASGNTDTYTTDHSWYSGSAWAQPAFDGQLFGKTLLSASGINNIKINDIRFVNAGTAAANNVMAFKFINCSYLELSHNTFAPESWGCLYVSPEKSGDYYDIIVHHNDISHCAFAMRFVPAAPSAIMHNVQVYNNDIHDFHSQLSGEVHGDGIQHYCSPDNATSYDRYIDGFKIFNNRFYGDFSQVAGSGGAMTALIYLSGASVGVQIFNNVFTPQYSGSQSPNFFESFISLRDNPSRGGHHKIYNNTFVTRVAGGQAAAILEDDARYPSPELDIKNNIFSNFNWPFDLRSTNHTIDNNDDDFIRDIGKWAGDFVGSFANWQALGLDVHGISVPPGFVSATDFHLGTTSPCIGRGANLSTIVATDIDGNARPATAGFSLGAYESGGTPPPPPVVPSVPVLSAPASGAAGVAIAPAFLWSTVVGAASYSVQVSTVSGFSSTVINRTGITSTSYEANGLSNNTTYYWRVNASNASGTSGWSSTGNFTTIAAVSSAPVLSLPADGATGVVTDPVLFWSVVSDAASYTIQVSTVPGFSSTNINQTGITETSYMASGLSNSTTYYWRVNASKAEGTSDWSSTGSFTTAAAAVVPSSVELWWPGNGATGVVINPSLTWSPDPGALSYAVQVSTVSDFATTIVNHAGIDSTSYEVNGLSGNTTYYWRVNFTNAVGASGWTSSGNFTTIAAAPPIPVPSLPANGATGTAVSPLISWNAVSGAVSYALQISTVSDFSSTKLNQAGIASMSYKATDLLNGTTYYWRVSAVNAIGTSGWSTTGSFTTEAPASPTLKLWWPGNGATGIVINPSLTWSPDPGALSYSLQISIDSTFATTLLYQRSITSNSFEVPGLSTSTQYFWRVCVTKASGISGWSQPTKFTVGTSAEKGTTSISMASARLAPHELDINSCRNGVVQVSLPFSGAYRLSIFTLSGQKAFEFTGNIGSAGFLGIPLKGANVPHGLYMMRLSVKGATVSKKMVVTK